MADVERVWWGKAAGNEGKFGFDANWVGGTKPALNDIPVFQGATSNQNVDDDLVQTALTVRKIIIDEDWEGDIGSESAYLQIGVDNTTGIIFNRGVGQVWIDTSGAVDPSEVKVRTEETVNATHIKCTTIAEMNVEKGLVYLEDGTITLLHMEMVGNILHDARVYANDGVITTLRKIGGELWVDGATITTLYNQNGNVEVLSGTITNLENYNDNVTWKTTTTLVSAKIWGGSFDASKDARAKTITAIEMHGEARVNVDNGMDNITIGGNGIKKYGRFDPVYSTGSEIASS